MLITVDDLKKGDEILIPVNGKFIYAKVLRDLVPCIKKDATGAKVPDFVTWGDRNGQPKYKSMKCSVRIEETKSINTYGSHSYTNIKRKYICTGEDHNSEKYFDLNYKQLWRLNN